MMSSCTLTAAGVLMSAAEVQRAAALCAAAGSWLVLDNTYEDFVYDGRQHHCASGPHVINLFSACTACRCSAIDCAAAGVACYAGGCECHANTMVRMQAALYFDIRDCVFRCHATGLCINVDRSTCRRLAAGFSKAYGMMGWRVGYIAYPNFDGSNALGEQILKVQDSIPICAAQLSQHIALRALADGGEYVKSNIASLAANRAMVLDAMAPLGRLGDGIAGAATMLGLQRLWVAGAACAA